MKNRATPTRPCRNCRGLFTARRMLRYCSNPCRDEAAKKQRAKWERDNPRNTYLYRDKQLELALDNPRTDAYGKPS